MIRPEHIEAISRRIGDLLPPSLQEQGESFQNNLRAALSAQLDRLDLVTREEFEVQRVVLMRTREQLSQLVARVDALEAELTRRSGGG